MALLRDIVDAELNKLRVMQDIVESSSAPEIDTTRQEDNSSKRYSLGEKNQSPNIFRVLLQLIDSFVHKVLFFSGLSRGPILKESTENEVSSNQLASVINTVPDAASQAQKIKQLNEKYVEGNREIRRTCYQHIQTEIEHQLLQKIRSKKSFSSISVKDLQIAFEVEDHQSLARLMSYRCLMLVMNKLEKRHIKGSGNSTESGHTVRRYDDSDWIPNEDSTIDQIIYPGKERFRQAIKTVIETGKKGTNNEPIRKNRPEERYVMTKHGREKDNEYAKVFMTDAKKIEGLRVFLTRKGIKKWNDSKGRMQVFSTSRYAYKGSKGTAAVVITNSGKMYAANHLRGEQSADVFFHSVITQGASVAFAGDITVSEKGKIVELGGYSSGHYESENCLHVIKLLMNKGVDLSSCEYRDHRSYTSVISILSDEIDKDPNFLKGFNTIALKNIVEKFFLTDSQRGIVENVLQERNRVLPPQIVLKA
jgi:hypothetical protein